MLSSLSINLSSTDSFLIKVLAKVCKFIVHISERIAMRIVNLLVLKYELKIHKSCKIFFLIINFQNLLLQFFIDLGRILKQQKSSS